MGRLPVAFGFETNTLHYLEEIEQRYISIFDKISGLSVACWDKLQGNRHDKFEKCGLKVTLREKFDAKTRNYWSEMTLSIGSRRVSMHYVVHSFRGYRDKNFVVTASSYKALETICVLATLIL